MTEEIVIPYHVEVLKSRTKTSGITDRKIATGGVDNNPPARFLWDSTQTASVTVEAIIGNRSIVKQFTCSHTSGYLSITSKKRAIDQASKLAISKAQTKAMHEAYAWIYEEKARIIAGYVRNR